MSDVTAGNEDSGTEQAGLKTVANTLRVLEHVAASDYQPKIGEISRALEISRPATYRIVESLIANGYLIRDERDGRLSMGLVILQLAGSLLDKNRLRREALPHLQNLAADCNERVTLGVLFQDQIFSIASIEKPTLPSVYSRFGNPVPAHSCGLGKAILAFSEEVEVRRIARERPLIARTSNTITSLDALLQDFEATRARGYAIDRSEGTVGSFCVAAPVFGAGGQPVGSISISGRSLDAVEQHVSKLHACAELVSHML